MSKYDPIVTFFKTHPFGGFNGTLLSTLPPEDRVEILKRILEFDQSDLVRDKLIMAQVKAGDTDGAIRTVDQWLQAGEIHPRFAEIYLTYKISALSGNAPEGTRPPGAQGQVVTFKMGDSATSYARTIEILENELTEDRIPKESLEFRQLLLDFLRNA